MSTLEVSRDIEKPIKKQVTSIDICLIRNFISYYTYSILHFSYFFI